MIPLCRDDGVAVIPWSPLARGQLTRDWNDETERSRTDVVSKSLYANTTDADRAIVTAVAEIAKARGVPRAQVALAWVAQVPGVTAPIIGASKPGHLTDALAALDLTLTAEELAALQGPYQPRRVAGHA